MLSQQFCLSVRLSVPYTPLLCLSFRECVSVLANSTMHVLRTPFARKYSTNCTNIKTTYKILRLAGIELVTSCLLTFFNCHDIVTVNRPSFDNAQSRVTAFRPISVAARSWSDDNTNYENNRAGIAVILNAGRSGLSAGSLPHTFLCRPAGLASSVCCACPYRIRPSQFPIAPVVLSVAV